MKVKLLFARAGNDYSQEAGDVIEVDDREGRRLVESGQAEPSEGDGRAKPRPSKSRD